MLYKMTYRLKYVERDWFRDFLSAILFFPSKLRRVAVTGKACPTVTTHNLLAYDNYS